MRRVALAGLLVALSVLYGCSSGSGTDELARDRADETVPGNLPTAPTTDPENRDGLGAEANVLLDELESLQDERDLCAVLSGAALEGLLRDDLDPTGLVTNPAGLTRLIAGVDAAFAHLVEIAPPELTASMQTVREVWTRLASIGQVPDAEQRINAVLAEPQVIAANQAILTWATTNCVAAP